LREKVALIFPLNGVVPGNIRGLQVTDKRAIREKNQPKRHGITRKNSTSGTSNPSPAAKENRSISSEMACFSLFLRVFPAAFDGDFA
jgi:hypothetical protein